MDKVGNKSSFLQLKCFNPQVQKSVSYGVSMMSRNDQYGRRLWLWEETADAPCSVYEISMVGYCLLSFASSVDG